MLNSDALHQKSGKASFDHVYDLDDPREYFGSLGRFDYQIPQHGWSLFAPLVEALRREKGSHNGNGAVSPDIRVVDLCCSYGVNAALLRHETTLDDLYARYGSEEVAGLSSGELAGADAAFYAEHRREAPPGVVGLDVAGNAVSYGVSCGLLDAGFAENLEENEPSEALRQAVSGADLVTVTGGVGYVTERTFERLLDCVVSGPEGRIPWVAALALRWVSYEDIAEVLSKYGLVTEKLESHTFVQRRFIDAAEREYVLEELAGMDIDPAGKEDEGWYHANFYLSRPAEDAKTPPEALLGL